MSNGVSHVGFHGTPRPMTDEEAAAITAILEAEFAEHESVVAHHCDCLGQDERFHEIARSLGCSVIVHPPSKESVRAHCDFDEERTPLPYSARNNAMADECDVLVFAPDEDERSTRGIWQIVEYATLKRKRNVIVGDDQK